MKPDVTIGTVFCNGLYALRLMWRSYAHYNSEVPVNFWCWNNDSLDGAAEYAQKMAKTVFNRSIRTSHQQGAREMCLACETQFFLLVDVDVEFLAPFTTHALCALLDDSNALCVAYPAGSPAKGFKVGLFDGLFEGAPRIDPCCVMFRTDKIKELLRYSTFDTLVDTGSRVFYDVGAVLRKDAVKAGMAIIEPSWVRNAVKHYGQIGAYVGNHKLDDKLTEALRVRYETIKRRSDFYVEVYESFGNS